MTHTEYRERLVAAAVEAMSEECGEAVLGQIRFALSQPDFTIPSDAIPGVKTREDVQVILDVTEEFLAYVRAFAERGP